MAAALLLVAGRGASRGAPEGWTRKDPARPFTLAGEVHTAAPPWAWVLRPQGELQGPVPARSLELLVRLPPGGRARAGLGADLRTITSGEALAMTGDGVPRVLSDVGRVEIRRLRVDGRKLPGPIPAGPAAAVAALGLVLGALAGPWLRLRRLLLLVPPLALGLLLLAVDPAAVAETLRVPALASPWLPARVGLGGLGLALALLLAWPRLLLDRGRARPVLAALALGPCLLLLGALFGLSSPGGLVGLGLAGACLGLLLLVNRNAARVAAFNLWSLALVALAVVGLELAAAASEAAQGWRAALDWSRVFAEAAGDMPGASPRDFADLEAGQHTRYPARGYPVAYPEKGTRPRLVCLGGSSTGGAWQMDDLRRFYPAQIEALLGGRVEVLNQGVGGWTTFHIRRYLERHLEPLAPDLVTLYVGHNDAGRGYPLPIAALYEGWRDQAQAPGWRPALLQWALVLRAAPVGDGPAVPVADSVENLRSIAAAVRARGGRVLLVGEAVAGPGQQLLPWREAMAELAREEGLAFVDAQPVLGGRREAFLDDVHLSDQGHEQVARLLVEQLLALGWVSAPAGPAEGSGPADAPGL